MFEYMDGIVDAVKELGQAAVDVVCHADSYNLRKKIETLAEAAIEKAA